MVFVAIFAVFFAGFGHGTSDLDLGMPPPVGTPTARAIEWLTAVERANPTLPAALGLAVMAQASGGQVYGDRYYCVRGSAEQSSGAACARAFGSRWKNLGEAYGLMGLNVQDVTLPKASSGNTSHAVRWNVDTGIRRLADSLAQAGDLKAALSAFHQSTQAPPTWRVSDYAAIIKAAIRAYSAPQMAIWALAP